MRIISKERDYYDCIQRNGSDQGNVFLRKMDTFTSNEVNFSNIYPKLTSMVERINDFIDVNDLKFDSWRWNGSQDREGCRINVEAKFLYFCGEMRPFLSFSSDSFGSDCLFEEDDPYKFITRYVDDTETYLEETISFTKKTRLSILKKFLREAGRAVDAVKLDEIFVEVKAPIFLISTKRQSYSRLPSKINLTVNPNLRDLGLIRHLDPTQAFQKIDMYLNNNMVNVDDSMIRISDKDMAVSKGFGHKYSFKNEPGKKRSRKKR